MYLNTPIYSNPEYTDLWNVVDFLYTGNVTYIQELIALRMSTTNDTDHSSSEKMSNIWVPHQYSYEMRKLVTTVITSLETTGLSAKMLDNFTGSKVTYDTFVKNSIISMLNYGGVASAIVPINGKEIIKLIPGKNIVQTCVDAFGELEHIKWFVNEDEYNEESDIIDTVTVFYTFTRDKNKVSLYVTKNETTLKLPLNVKEIPVVGITLNRLHDDTYQGSPYLSSLAINSIRMMISSVNLSHLLDNVMTPRLIYKGATPIKKLESTKWQGVNIGINDTLQYLEHSGASLDAAKAQIERNREDINGICSFMSQPDKQKTAYEVAQITAANETLKSFLIDGVLKYLNDLFMLMNSRAKATYIEPVVLDVETPNDKNKLKDNPKDQKKEITSKSKSVKGSKDATKTSN